MKRFVAAITLGVYVVTTIPYIFGYAIAGSEMRFTGIVFDVVDTAQYFAWMRSFSHDVVIANPITPEPGSERFFNLQWWLLGLLAFKTPIGTVLAYQLLRVVALAGFAAAVAYFCRLVAPQRAKLAFAIVMLASGFGWMLVVLKYVLNENEVRFPLDIHVGEANSYFSAMAFPHLLVAGAMLLSIFILFLHATRDRRWPLSAALVPLTLCLGFSHGYDLIPAMVIPSAMAILLSYRERRLSEYVFPAAAIVIGGIPPALYALALTHLDATWEGVLSQYDNAGVFSPAPHHLVILLGLPFLLALPQLRRPHWRTNDIPGLFVRVWMLIGFFLLYIPTDYQIKMLIAYQVPVGILAAQTIVQIDRSLTDRIPRFSINHVRMAAVLLFIGFIALTNVYLTMWRIVELRRLDYPFYLEDADVAAIEELNSVAGKHDVVLSSPEIGAFVPVYSDSRPYVAHWAQTLDYRRRVTEAELFFHPDISNADRAAFLDENGIDFVIAGPAEAQLARSPTPPELDLERLIRASTTLYRNAPELAR